MDIKSSRAAKLSKDLKENMLQMQGYPNALPPKETPLDPEGVRTALQKRLGFLRIEGITVDKVKYDQDGSAGVELSDLEGNHMMVIFGCEDDGPSAMVLDSGRKDKMLVIDLDPLAPSFVYHLGKQYINLVELSWLNKSTMMTILTGGDLDLCLEKPISALQYDAFGNILGVPRESIETIQKEDRKVGEVIVESSVKVVMRGGKRTRLPILHWKNTDQLSYKQITASVSATAQPSKWTRTLKVKKSA